MGKDKRYSIDRDLQKSLNGIRSSLESYVETLGLLYAICVDIPSAKERWKEQKTIEENMRLSLLFLLQGVCLSCDNLLKLSETVDYHSRDCYTIARGIVESSVNICYLMATGSEVAKKAFNHAKQKQIREITKLSEIGNSKFKISLKGFDEVEKEKFRKELDEFTNKKGREKNWVDDSVKERIEKIGDRFGDDILKELHLVYLSIYSTSSEILHGSIFGSMKFLGFTLGGEKDFSSDRITDSMGEGIFLVLLSVTKCASAIMVCFHRTFEFEMLEKINKEIEYNLDTDIYFRKDKSKANDL